MDPSTKSSSRYDPRSFFSSGIDPDPREQGLNLFERLLALDLYGARSTLNEIDFARREH